MTQNEQAATNNMFMSFKSLGSAVVSGVKNTLKEKDIHSYNCGNCPDGSHYKDSYLRKFGLFFTIPSLNVRSSTWYTTDPSYFV